MTATTNYVESARMSLVTSSNKEATHDQSVLNRAAEQLSRAILALRRLRKHIS
jgi:hypothetical protein